MTVKYQQLIFGIIFFGYYIGQQGAHCFDYCTLINEKTCPTHVGCNETEIPDEYSKKFSPLTDTQKFALLNVYNSLKNEIALGWIGPYRLGANISVVIWNTELESLARLVSKIYHPISYRVDKCLDTMNFRYNEQENHESFNLKHNSPEKLIEALDQFYRNSLLNEAHTIDGLVQLSHIGCQYYTYHDYFNEEHAALRCIVNFGNRKYPEFEPYLEGPPCSRCTTYCHSNYAGLCQRL